MLIYYKSVCCYAVLPSATILSAPSGHKLFISVNIPSYELTQIFILNAKNYSSMLQYVQLMCGSYAVDAHILSTSTVLYPRTMDWPTPLPCLILWWFIWQRPHTHTHQKRWWNCVAKKYRPWKEVWSYFHNCLFEVFHHILIYVQKRTKLIIINGPLTDRLDNWRSLYCKKLGSLFRSLSNLNTAILHKKSHPGFHWVISQKKPSLPAPCRRSSISFKTGSASGSLVGSGYDSEVSRVVKKKLSIRNTIRGVRESATLGRFNGAPLHLGRIHVNVPWTRETQCGSERVKTTEADSFLFQ